MGDSEVIRLAVGSAWSQLRGEEGSRRKYLYVALGRAAPRFRRRRTYGGDLEEPRCHSARERRKRTQEKHFSLRPLRSIFLQRGMGAGSRFLG